MNFDPVVNDPLNRDAEFPSSMSAAIFQSKGKKIIGTMFITSGEGPHPLIIMLHGFPGNEHNFDLAHAARRAGWNVLVFHYRGSWGSEGDYSIANTIEDVKAAIEYAKSEFVKVNFRVDPNRIVLTGHSLGGFNTLLNCAKSEEIKHAASFAGFNFGYFANFIEDSEEIKDMTLNGLEIGSMLLTNVTGDKLLSEILDHKTEWNLLHYAEKLLNKNLLLVGADFDTIAPKEIHHDPLVSTLEDMGHKNLTAKVLHSGHSFSDRRIELAKTYIDWLNKIEF